MWTARPVDGQDRTGKPYVWKPARGLGFENVLADVNEKTAQDAWRSPAQVQHQISLCGRKRQTAELQNY
jgi:hypothetical protein